MIWRTTIGLASRGRLSILIFHRIRPEPDPILPSEPSAGEFEALLRHIASRFVVLRLSDAVRALDDGTLPARALAITFDDGYADNLTIAAPILARFRMPATVFVASGYLDGTCMFNDLVIEAVRSSPKPALDLSPMNLGRHDIRTLDQRRAAIDRILAVIKYLPAAERARRAADISQIADTDPPRHLMMTFGDVRKLTQFGIEVGAHTVQHPILSRLPLDEARREITESKHQLELLTGRQVTGFAYPNGKPGVDYGKEHVDLVREAGFEFAVSGAWGAANRRSDRWQLPRFTPWSRRPLKFDILMLRNLACGIEERAA